MKNQHENEIQDFREKFEDMDHKVERLNKKIFHLSIENRSLRSLVSFYMYHDPSNVSLEDVRAQIDEEIECNEFFRHGKTFKGQVRWNSKSARRWRGLISSRSSIYVGWITTNEPNHKWKLMDSTTN